MISSPLTVNILILSFTCENIDVVVVTMISANYVRFATQTRISNSTKMATALGLCLVFKTVVSHYRRNNTHLTDSEWKKKTYLGATTVEKEEL